MSEVARSELYDADGHRLLTVDGRLTADALPIDDRAVALACGATPGEAGGSCPRHAVMATAERLGFVTRRGTPKGCVTILPRGVLLEQCVEAFNRQHVQALDATRIDFPLLFDRRVDGLASLTDSYERQRRMYRLAGDDHDLRLAYAADPGLFSWLTGARLRSAALPWAVHSPTPVFRRFRSGEVGGFDRLRQYTVPDLHVLAAPDTSLDAYVRCVQAAAEGARFWFGQDFAQFVEVVDGVYEAEPAIGARAARAAGCPTVVRILARRPRYYSLKGGIVVPSGTGLVMLYNVQLDDTNGERFDLRLDDGRPAHIVHGTLAGGWPKLLPLVIGRGLAGMTPKTIPVELAATQVVAVTIGAEQREVAHQWAAGLRQRGIRVDIDERTQHGLGRRLRRLRETWQPYHAVIGEREASGGDQPLIAAPDVPTRLTAAEFLECHGRRLERCAPAANPASFDLPFA